MKGAVKCASAHQHCSVAGWRTHNHPYDRRQPLHKRVCHTSMTPHTLHNVSMLHLHSEGRESSACARIHVFTGLNKGKVDKDR